MKVKCINDIDFASDKVTIGNIYEVLSEGASGFKIIGDDKRTHYLSKERFEIVENGKEVEGKTFRQVMADIKEGEIWVSGSKQVQMVDGDIYVSKANGEDFDTDSILFSNTVLYELKRYEYSFEEAFEAYEEDENNVIQSCVTGRRYNQLYEDSNCNIKVEEIRGKWYIHKRLKDEF